MAAAAGSAALGNAVAADTDRTSLGAWDAYETAEAPTAPYAGEAGKALDLAHAVSEWPNCVEAWIDPTKPPARFCHIGTARATADGAANGPSDAVPPVTESTPRGTCLAVEARAATCTRGGSGTHGDGRTYYKGDEGICELQRPDVDSTNHRVPKVVYNSIRYCRGMTGRIQSRTRDHRLDWDTWRHGSGPPDTLLWQSFSARYRINYCMNDSESSVYVRCAYDWVR